MTAFFDFRRHLSDVDHDELRQIISEAAFLIELAQIGIRLLGGDGQEVDAPHRRAEFVASGQPYLILVGIVFHLARREAGHAVADPHQDEQDAARQPDHQPR